MYASRWVVQKLIKFVNDEELCNKLDEVNKLFSRYSDDYHMNKVHEEFKEYCKKPSKKNLKSINKGLDDMLKMRRFQASGGTRLSGTLPNISANVMP